MYTFTSKELKHGLGWLLGFKREHTIGQDTHQNAHPKTSVRGFLE